MKINYQARPEIDLSINIIGGYVVSNKDGKTRKKGKVYRILANPKTQEKDPNFVWYLSEMNFPCKISNKSINSFRAATKAEIKNYKNQENEDTILD